MFSPDLKLYTTQLYYCRLWLFSTCARITGRSRKWRRKYASVRGRLSISQVQERTATNPLSDNVFKSTVLSSLASLKSELAEVKSDLRRVEQRQVTNHQPQSTVQSCPCLLYLRLSRALDSPLGKNGLQILLGCTVEQYPFEV